MNFTRCFLLLFTVVSVNCASIPICNNYQKGPLEGKGKVIVAKLAAGETTTVIDLVSKEFTDCYISGVFINACIDGQFTYENNKLKVSVPNHKIDLDILIVVSFTSKSTSKRPKLPAGSVDPIA